MAEIRVSVEDEFFAELKKKLGGIKTAEMVQEALTLLNWAVDASMLGRDILSADPARSDWERVVLPRLAAIRAKARPSSS